MAPSLFNEVPRDEQAWLRAATAAGVENKTLRTYDKLKSASKVTKPQILLYRTIFARKDGRQFNPANFGLGARYTNAQNLLQNSQDFQSYINAIQAGAFGGTGNFTPLREQQREVLECLSGTGMILTQKDESPVNATFINMLQAIGTVSPAIRARWRHTKIELIADFGRGRSFSAITDGQLQDIQTGEIQAIAECKRDRRQKNRVKIDMQEASQIVALIRHFSSTALLYVKGPSVNGI
jgi:hypothetical protein